MPHGNNSQTRPVTLLLQLHKSESSLHYISCQSDENLCSHRFCANKNPHSVVARRKPLLLVWRFQLHSPPRHSHVSHHSSRTFFLPAKLKNSRSCMVISFLLKYQGFPFGDTAITFIYISAPTPVFWNFDRKNWHLALSEIMQFNNWNSAKFEWHSAGMATCAWTGFGELLWMWHAADFLPSAGVSDPERDRFLYCISVFHVVRGGWRSIYHLWRSWIPVIICHFLLRT